MRESRRCIAAMLLLACGSVPLLACGSEGTAVPAPSSTPPAAPTVVGPTVVGPTEPPLTPPSPGTSTAPAVAPTAEAPVAPAALPASGLPEVTVGPALRVPSTLPVTTRPVGGRTLPSVTLASPIAQTSLDAWFEEKQWCRGRVQLAIEGLVSYVCTYSEPAGPGGSARAAMNVRITETGEAVELEDADFFVAGTDVRAMMRVWADDPGSPSGELSFGPAGAVIVPSDEGEELVRIPWRRLAPYVRVDGPLGPALAAAGLTLAPAGASAPPVPARASALIARDASHAIAIAAGLPATVRAGTRLRVDSIESALLLPPGTDLAQLPGAASGVRQEERYFFGALAELVTVRVDDAVEIHQSAGPRTPVIGAMPAGAVTVAARGAIEARVSEPGSGWVLLAGGRSTGGYVQGRHVSLLEGCGAPAGSGQLPSPALTGYAELDADSRLAWTLAPTVEGTSTVVTLFPVASDCVIGEQARRVEVQGTVTSLRVVAATEGGEEWLTVITTAVDLSAPARSVSVFGPSADAPRAFTMAAEAPVVRVAEGRASTYFPVVIEVGEQRTRLRWTGTTLEAVAPQ